MQVLGNAILIKPDKLPESKGKVHIPQTSQEMKQNWGTIVQAGPACETYKVGDHVKFPRKSASIYEEDGEEYFFIYEFQILFGR